MCRMTSRREGQGVVERGVLLGCVEGHFPFPEVVFSGFVDFEKENSREVHW